jgi:hypothetical protein
MESKWVFFGSLALLAFTACGGNSPGPVPGASASAGPSLVEGASLSGGGAALSALSQGDRGALGGDKALEQSLDELAELERSGVYRPGMALTESGLREAAGDYPGAALAAYKEMAFLYGGGVLREDAVDQGLRNVAALGEGGASAGAALAASGILAFVRGDWDEAAGILRGCFDPREEPDGFAQWLLLVCALERDKGDRQASAAYRAIRARYTRFPEYWYRGARAFSASVAAEYAEYCISLAPQGPFAAECRNILAVHAGLRAEDGASLRSKLEIEDIISRSVGREDPEILSDLLPLIGLPDNPYTVYAVGALRALVSVPRFREYLSARAGSSRGRLAERLAYICRA